MALSKNDGYMYLFVHLEFFHNRQLGFRTVS